MSGSYKPWYYAFYYRKSYWIFSYTLRKSNSNHVSFALPYSSTACGSLPSLLFDFH